MYKNKISRWIFLSAFLPFFAHAQSNYKPGYLVNLKNDTLKGFIDYREWEKNPTSFNFKNTTDSKEPTKYSVINAAAFGINNLISYQRSIVDVSMGNVEVSSLSAGIDSTYKTDTVFLKVITRGKYVSLFYFTDALKTRFYIEDKKTQQVKELNYYVYLDNENNSSIKTVNSFRSQLQTLALAYQPNNNKLVDHIQRTDYSEIGLKSVINDLNGGAVSKTETKGLSATRFFAGVGVSSNKITFTTVGGPFPAGYSKTSTVPTISGGAEIILNKNTQKVILRAEIKLGSNEFKFASSTPTDLVSANNLDLKQFNASFAPQVIYNFYSGSKLKTFIGAGLSINLSFYNNYNYLKTYNDGQVVALNKYPNFNKAWFNMPLKAGVLISNRVEIFGTYYLSASIVSSNSYSANEKVIAGGVNILF